MSADHTRNLQRKAVRDPFAELRQRGMAIRMVVLESGLVLAMVVSWIVLVMMVQRSDATKIFWTALCPIPAAIIAGGFYLIRVWPRINSALDVALQVLADPASMSPQEYQRDLKSTVGAIPNLALWCGFVAMLLWAILTTAAVAVLDLPLPRRLHEFRIVNVAPAAVALILQLLMNLSLRARIYSIASVVHLVAWQSNLRAPWWMWKVLSWSPRTLLIVATTFFFFTSQVFLVENKFVGEAAIRRLDSCAYVAQGIVFIIAALAAAHSYRVDLDGGDLGLLENIVDAREKPFARSESSRGALGAVMRMHPIERRLAAFLAPILQRMLHIIVHFGMRVHDGIASLEDALSPASQPRAKEAREILGELKLEVSTFQRMPKRIRDLVSGWTKAHYASRELVDIVGVVRRVSRNMGMRDGQIEILAASEDDKSTIVCEGAEDVVMLAIDNLIENAGVTTRALHRSWTGEQALISVVISFDDRTVRVDVRDRGAGFLPALRQQLHGQRGTPAAGAPAGFHPVPPDLQSGYGSTFTWGDRVVGSGAGLHFVSAVASAYGGHLWINPDPGDGWATVVRFEIPGEMRVQDIRDAAGSQIVVLQEDDEGPRLLDRPKDESGSGL